MIPSTLLATLAIVSYPLLPLAQQSDEAAVPTEEAAPEAVVELDEVTVDADGVTIDRSSAVTFGATPIADTNGDGIVRIAGDDLTIDFGGSHLIGSPADADPDTFSGTGVHVTGKNITIKGLKVSGYKVGIHAVDADGLVIEDCDVSDNYRQRLLSTPEAEDAKDWLRPHANDNQEWITNYGAGIYVHRSNNVKVRRCRSWYTQNGLILDRVQEGRVYDNDFSFLSGWGLAMWRTVKTAVSRNQFDYCVRGYSHGVYNRGQDSAGILMFEQCRENVIVQNSATHCGDGFFGFSGNEALGQHPAPSEDFDYTERGNKRNLLLWNDFSNCVAHGVEMTFGFRNEIIENRISGNAICGIWAGYSRSSKIALNQIARNGDMGVGLERGGVNIEHGRNNIIQNNWFIKNKCGVHLWWDEDEGLMSLPWTEANGHDSRDNFIVENTFSGDELAVQLRNTLTTFVAGNDFNNVETILESDDVDQIIGEASWAPAKTPEIRPLGDNAPPTFKREILIPREGLVMTEWGPYDHQTPLLHRLRDQDGSHVYTLLGPESLTSVEVEGPVSTRIEKAEKPKNSLKKIFVTPNEAKGIAAYELVVTGEPTVLRAEGVIPPRPGR